MSHRKAHRLAVALAAALTGTLAVPASAQVAVTGDYFIRPYAGLGGSIIDGLDVNGATSGSVGFADKVFASVDLSDGVARAYVNVTGPNAGGSATGTAAGVFGDTLTFFGVDAPVAFSFSYDGTVVADARTNAGSLLQIGGFATLYVFDVAAGANNTNFTLTPGALLARTGSFDFSNPAADVNAIVNETLAGSVNIRSGHSYDIFASLSVFSAVNDNASTVVLDFTNTGRFGITAPATLVYTSASGVFQPGPAAVPGVPEPASWAMLIAGVGLVGGALRRRPARALPLFA